MSHDENVARTAEQLHRGAVELSIHGKYMRAQRDLDLRADEGLTCASVVRLWLRDVRVTPTTGPDLALRDARDVWIDGIRHDRPAATFLDLRGRRTARVHLASARDATVRPAIVLGVDVPRDALVQD